MKTKNTEKKRNMDRCIGIAYLEKVFKLEKKEDGTLKAGKFVQKAKHNQKVRDYLNL